MSRLLGNPRPRGGGDPIGPPDRASGSEPATPIEIRITQPQQLFNSLDPSPFYERDLDQDAEEYIVDSADEYPLKHPLRLGIYLPAHHIHEQTPVLAHAIHNYFATARRRPGDGCGCSSVTGAGRSSSG